MRKKHFLLLWLCLTGITAVAQPPSLQNCIVEAGKGCGQLKLGASRQEVEDLFGGSIEKAGQFGITVVLGTSKKLEQINFIFTEGSINITEQQSFYKGRLEKGLGARSSPEQFINAYGRPVNRKESEFLGSQNTVLYFNGLEAYFTDNVLSQVIIKPTGSIKQVEETKEKEIDLKETDRNINFDALLSNIDIMTAGTTAKNVAPQAVTPKPDCKYIMDFENCRNILFNMTSKQVLEYFGKTEGKQYGMVTEYLYKGIKVLVANTDRVESVEFIGFSMMDFKRKQPYSEYKPLANIDWGDSKGKITDIMGKPQNVQKLKSVDGDKVEVLYYSNYHESFEFVNGDLVRMEFKRKPSDEEYATMRSNLQRQRDSLEALKTPQQRAKERAAELMAAFNELHERIDFYVGEINKNIKSYSVTDYNKRRNEEAGVSNLKGDLIKIIDQFLNAHKGQMPPSMITHLENDKQKILAGEGH